jgi:hypothetical protein
MRILYWTVFVSFLMLLAVTLPAAAATITYGLDFISFEGLPGGTGTITFEAASIRHKSSTPTLISFSADIDGYTASTSSLLPDGCGNPPGSAFLCEATYGRRGNLESFFLSSYATNFFTLDLAIFNTPQQSPEYLMYITGGPGEGIVDEGHYSVTETPEPTSLVLIMPVVLLLISRSPKPSIP